MIPTRNITHPAPHSRSGAGISLLLTMLFLLFGQTGCQREPTSIDQIRQSGVIKVITHNSAHGYYIYREQPMGFEYDLAQAFADHLGVELMVVTPVWNNIFAALTHSEGDLIAASLTITPGRETDAAFSDPYMQVQQQVITQKSNYNCRSIDDLSDKTIHVRKNTSYHLRLKELQQEGVNLKLIVYDNIPTEEFIRRVHAGYIEYTVADSNIVRLNQRYYPDIRVAFPISEEQPLGWAVRKSDKPLLKEINRFFETIEKDGTYAKVYNRYYSGTEIFDYVDIKKFHRRLKTRLPLYKPVIRRESEKHGFDWRLITAMIYQESHFDPQARSFAGAEGLMQLTAITAETVGVHDRTDPVQSIKGGVAYLNRLYRRFEEIPEHDRLKFALASYNIGYGHIRDAQKIAKQKGWDPKQWESLKKALPLLRYRKYFADTRYGYARGTEPVRYVSQVLKYYDILRMKSRI